MVYAMRSKKSLSGKPRVSSASAGRKKEGFKSRRNKYESDDDDNDSYVTKPTRSFSNRKTGENSFSRPKPYGDAKGRGFIRGGSGASRELRGEQRPKWGPPKDFGGDGGRVMRGEQRPKWGPRKDISGDGSGEKRSREMRGEQRPKWGARKDYSGKDGFVEASDTKLRSKWKRMDKKGRGGDDLDDKRGSRGSQHTDRKGGKGRGKGVAEEGILEKDAESEDGEVVEKKFIKRQRVIDKTGKKIRIAQKHDDGSEAKDAPPKRKKRVIKLDPYDFSNKRIDDTVPSSAADAIANSAADVAEKDEKDNEISKNAQFRAIQPTSSILSFVEDNLIGRRRLSELKNAGYNTKISAPLDNTPFTTSLERDRIEENVFRNKLEFFAAAKISSSFPPPMIPEIAFAGRSNVGKSSLLNALSRQWGVVRTSDKPGLTQTINFFKLGPKLSLVDLPGYGFAYAKEEVKEAWEDLVKEYVSTRVGLQKVCLLIDTKWGMKPRDYELIDLMERSKTPYQVVLTKTDVIFPIDVARRAMQIQETLKKNKSIVNPVMMVSSKSGAGIRSLRTVLAKVARFVKP